MYPPTVQHQNETPEDYNVSLKPSSRSPRPSLITVPSHPAPPTKEDPAGFRWAVVSGHSQKTFPWSGPHTITTQLDGVAALFLQRSHVKLCGGSCTMARQDMEVMPCVRDSCNDSMSQIAAKTNGGRFSNGSGLKCQQKAEDSGTALKP